MSLLEAILVYDEKRVMRAGRAGFPRLTGKVVRLYRNGAGRPLIFHVNTVLMLHNSFSLLEMLV